MSHERLIACAATIALFAAPSPARAQNAYASANYYFGRGPVVSGYPLTFFTTPYRGSNVVLQNRYAYEPFFVQALPPAMGAEYGYPITQPTVETTPNVGVAVAPNPRAEVPPNPGYEMERNGEAVPTPTVVPPVPNTTAPKAANFNSRSNVLPRTSDAIEARLVRSGRLWLGWSGTAREVEQIEFQLLNSSHEVIADRIVMGPPADYTFSKNTHAAFYKVIVTYVNGATTRVMSPVPARQLAATASRRR